MKKAIYNKCFLIVFSLILLFGCSNINNGNSSSSGSSSNDIVKKGDRMLGFEIGYGADEEFIDAFNKAKEINFDFSHVSIRWTDVETSPNHYVDPGEEQGGYLNIINTFYPMHHTKVYFTILSPINTTYKGVPEDLKNINFDDPVFLSRFKSFLDFLMSKIPDVELIGLIIGNEVDIYLSSHQSEVNSFINFYNAVSAYARIIRPGLKVSCTATLYGTTGNMKTSMINLNNYTDFISLTYYPLYDDFTVKDPSIVKSEIKSVCNLYSKEIFFQECGYPTSNVCLSNEDLQSYFIEKVFNSWDTFNLKIKAISFYMLTDWPQSAVDDYLNEIGLTGNVNLGEYVRSLGFRYYDPTTEKKAFNTIKQSAKARGW